MVARRVTFAIPGDLATPTGGYGYARHVIASLRARDWDVTVIDLGDRFPHANADQRAHARRRLVAAPPEVPVVVDGLALGALPQEARDVARSHNLIGLVHHPLALETGLTEAAAEALRASETQALAAVRHVITTDHSTAATLEASYDVPGERISVARPGAPRVPFARGSSDGTVRILAVGACVPRKGYDLLVTALADLGEFPWHLTIAGDRTRSRDTALALDCMIERAQLADRIVCAGAVSDGELDALYRAADMFVQPSWFEGYGMALADAVAYGLPMVATQTGAAASNVSPAAGILVAPGDVAALTAALRALLMDANVRSRCRAAARAAAQNLPTWDDTAAVFEQVLTQIG